MVEIWAKFECDQFYDVRWIKKKLDQPKLRKWFIFEWMIRFGGNIFNLKLLQMLKYIKKKFAMPKNIKWFQPYGWLAVTGWLA